MFDGNSFSQPFNLCQAGSLNGADCQINQVLMEGVTVRNCYNFQNGVVIQCKNCQNLVVINSNFSYISKDPNYYLGQPSGLFQFDEGSRYLLIKNSTFKNIVTEGAMVTEVYQNFGNITVQDSIFAEIYSTKKNGGLFRSPQSQSKAQYTKTNNRTYWRQFVRPVFLYILNSDFRNISSRMHGAIVFQIPLYLRAINFNDSVFMNVTTQQSGAILFQGGKDYYTSSFQNSTLKQVFAFRGSVIDIEHVNEGFDINNTRIQCFSPELDIVRSPLTKKAQFPFIPGPVIRTQFWQEPIRIINSTVSNCISFQIGGVLSCGYYDAIPSKTTLQQCVYSQNSTFVNNSAYMGGVVATKHGDVNFQNSTFINNTAYQGGVIAISICYRFSNISSIIAINNSAIISGGFLYSWNNYSHSSMTQPQISLQKSYFENHHAKYGGLIGNEYSKIGLFLQYSQVKNSIASQYGGVLYGFNLLYFYFLSTDFYDCNANKGVLFYGTGDWYNPYYNYLEKLNLDCQFKKIGSLVTTRDLRYLWFELINFQNCVFTKGNSMFEIDYNSGAYIFDAVLQNNIADFATILRGTQISIAIYTSTMRNNTAWRAGVMSAFFQSSLNSYTVTYSNNRAIEKGGIIYASGNVQSLMSGCTIFNNTADEGSVGYYLRTSFPRTVTFDSTTKVYNNSANYSTIVVRDLSLVLRRSQFFDNYHFKDSSTVNALMSNITLSQASFWNSQRQVYGQKLLYYRGFLQSQFAGNFSVLNSTFINGSTYRGGAIYMISGGRLNMNNSIFLNNYASDSGGSIYSKDTKSFTIRNNSFRDNLAFVLGDDISAVRSYAPIWLNDSHFATSQGQQQVYFKNLFARLTNITFRNYDNANNYKQKDGGALQCIDCNQLIMNTTYFYNLSGSNGGALYIQESSVNILQKELIKSSSSGLYTNMIINSTFSNCSATQGGAIFVENAQNTSFTNCTFLNNSAQSFSSYPGKGGAIYITSNAQSNNTRCTFDSNTTFTSNNATTSGGAIFWENQEPFIQQNQSTKKIHRVRQDAVFQTMFLNNSALAYGNDVASKIQQIYFIDESIYQLIMSEQNSSLRRRAYEIEEISLTTQLYKNLRSGQQLDRIYVAVADIYGQIIANDQSTVLRIVINQSYNEGNELAQRYAPVLQGINTFTFTNGVILIDDLIFFSSPGFNHSIELSTDAIDTSSESSVDMKNILNSNELSQKIIIQLRNCELGEQFTLAGKCEMCEEGTYSIKIQASPSVCLACPTGAICLGGSNIGPDEGYWREDNLTTLFLKCPQASSCQGYIQSDQNPQGSCTKGYQGVLCADCQDGFMRVNNFECEQCPPEMVIKLKMAFSQIGLLLITAFLLYFTYKNHLQATFFKLILSHLHLLMITFAFQQSQSLDLIIYGQELIKAATISTYFLNFECLFPNYYPYISEEVVLSHFQAKVIFTSFLPLLIGVACLVIYGALYMQRNLKHHSHWILRSLNVFGFLIYPSVIYQMYLCFYYKKVGTNEVLYADFEIQRNSDQHINTIKYFAIPSIVLWGLAMPILAFTFMMLKRKELISPKDETTKLLIKIEYFKFLKLGFKNNLQYWEIFIFLRKLLLLFVIGVSQQLGVLIQSLLIIAIFLMQVLQR